MAKRKPKAKDLTIDDLVKLAEEVGLPPGLFDGDIEDACDEDAEMKKEEMKAEELYWQLEFLYLHGFEKQRLAELIREWRTQLQSEESPESRES